MLLVNIFYVCGGHELQPPILCMVFKTRSMLLTICNLLLFTLYLEIIWFCRPPKQRASCGVSGCRNQKKYSCSRTGVPLCSLDCYKKNLSLSAPPLPIPVTWWSIFYSSPTTEEQLSCDVWQGQPCFEDARCEMYRLDADNCKFSLSQHLKIVQHFI